MPESPFALDARLALIRAASSTLDLQYYEVANDSLGRLVMGELAQAARRGVRVRFLVDDLHTVGVDAALAALAQVPNVQVRLYNPFTWGRGSYAGRYAALLTDFGRLNRRMHNKLFVADGSVAVVGGRNLADEYFFRGESENFIDIDFGVMEAVTRQAEALFDEYWNSAESYPVLSIIHSGAEDRPASDTASAVHARPSPDKASDVWAHARLSDVLDGRARLEASVADVSLAADTPTKSKSRDSGRLPSLTAKFIATLKSARNEVVLFSPYFIPGERGVAELKALRKRGVRVTIVTNSIVTSDEPLVSAAFLPYREKLLEAGVRIFELDADSLAGDRKLRNTRGGHSGRLHAKLGIIDRQVVLAGSMNLDLRSAFTNTEIGMRVHSAEMAERLLSFIDIEHSPVVHELRLKPEGGVGLVFHRKAGDDVQDIPPAVGLREGLMSILQSVLFPEDLL